MKQSLILLFGMPRSGTTWIGKIFDSHPDTIYRHEPDSRGTLNALPLLAQTSDKEYYRAFLEDYASRLLAIRDEKISASLPIFAKKYYAAPQLALRKLLAYSVKVASRYLGPLPVPGIFDLSKHADIRIVWKSIESLGRLGVLASVFPTARCVLILRHPCGYIASVLHGETKRKFEGNSPSDEDWDVFNLLLTLPAARAHGLDLKTIQAMTQIKRLALKWALYYEHALAESAGQENVLVVRYEDFCAHPLEQTQQVFRHCNLAWHPQTEAFVADSTSHNESGYYSVFKNPKIAAVKWKQILSPDEVSDIKSTISGFAASAYYADE